MAGVCCLRSICYDRLCVFEEAAILESHGIEVQSPGGQSNSDEVDGNDFPDQVNKMQTVNELELAPRAHKSLS